MTRIVCFGLLLGIGSTACGQHSFSFQGQASALLNYGWENDYSLFTSGRYLPQINYAYELDSSLKLDAELSANVWTAHAIRPWDDMSSNSAVDPYRAWMRLDREHWSLRVGLQKIDFGSATLLRPLQWFNQLDPRDPLQLTNGVKAGLFRYYFSNNANIWVWGLYGNEDPRGLNPINTSGTDPEFGGRLQLPVPRGEIALSYHQQTLWMDLASPGMDPDLLQWGNRLIGLDGKWDLGIGLWAESQWSLQEYDTFFMASLGMDYTFSWGNGLYFLAEGLAIAEEGLRSFEGVAAAFMLMYPMGLYDQLQLIYYEAPPQGLSQDRLRIAMLNLQHQFATFTLNAAAYYNPSQSTGLVRNELFQSFAGPGLRLTFIYNH